VVAGVLGVAAYSLVVFALRGPLQFGAGCAYAFYALLLLNTCFSVSFTEAAFGIRSPSDALINIPLVGMYLAFPWVVGQSLLFFFLMGVFFTTAMIKYANWLTMVEANYFLRRKIIANGCGAALSLVTAAAIATLAHDDTTIAIATALYFYGNVHTLMIDPLYRLKS
jgi:hypothetical protein